MLYGCAQSSRHDSEILDMIALFDSQRLNMEKDIQFLR